MKLCTMYTFLGDVTNSTGRIKSQICVLKLFDLPKYELEYVHTYTGQNWSVHRSALRHCLIPFKK